MRTLATALVFCLVTYVASQASHRVAVAGLITALFGLALCAGVVACGSGIATIRPSRSSAPGGGSEATGRVGGPERKPRGRRGGPLGLTLIVAVALAWLRGLAVDDEPTWSLADRGSPRGLYTFHVRQAAQPGARCVFEATGSSGAIVRVEVEDMDCSVAAGDTVVAVAQTLVAASWPRDPVLQRSMREIPRFRAERAWIHRRAATGYWAWVARLRLRAYTAAQRDPARGLVAACVLGLRSGVSGDVASDFRRAGLGHLLAVSGLHVTLVVWLLAGVGTRAGAWIGAPAHGRFVAIVLPVLAYVGLTGAAPPAVRAGIMLVAWGLAASMGRPVHALTLLAVCAAGMLAWHPQWVLQVGFHLSFAAMAAVVTAPPNLSTLGLSWRICWWTAPVSLLSFGQASVAAVVANLLALPVFSLVLLPFGLATTLLPSPLDDVAGSVAASGARLLIDWAAIMAELPWPVNDAAGLVIATACIVLLTRWPRFASWRRHAPPVGLGVALLAAWMSSRAAFAGPFADFYAVAGPRSRALVLRKPGTADDPAPACFVGAKLSPGWWAKALPQLGVDDLGPIDAPRGYAEELREAWQRSHGGPVAAFKCPVVDESRLRAIVRACLRRADGFVWVRGSYHQSGDACFVRGRWHSLGGP